MQSQGGSWGGESQVPGNRTIQITVNRNLLLKMESGRSLASWSTFLAIWVCRVPYSQVCCCSVLSQSSVDVNSLLCSMGKLVVWIL